jgi:hypothetical protein
MSTQNYLKPNRGCGDSHRKPVETVLVHSDPTHRVQEELETVDGAKLPVVLLDLSPWAVLSFYTVIDCH